MGTDFCLELESMERCIEQECGRWSAEYIDTGPVVQVHRALCCQNRKHSSTGGKIGVLLCR